MGVFGEPAEEDHLRSDGGLALGQPGDLTGQRVRLLVEDASGYGVPFRGGLQYRLGGFLGGSSAS